MARILIFPYPGGYGPLSNCAALADALIKRHQSVAFAYAGPSLPVLEQAGYTILPIHWPPPAPAVTPTFHDKPFKLLHRMDDFVTMFTLHDPTRLRFYLNEQLRLVDEWQPDILIGSWTFTLGLVGRLRGLPVVHIYQALMHPGTRTFQWWQTEKTQSEEKSLASLNDLLQEYKQPKVESVEAFISMGDLLLIPGIPEIEPLPTHDQRAHYIGHLIWRGPSDKPLPPWMDSYSSAESKKIYVYEGGARYGPRLYNALINLFGKTTSSVVIATGMETPSHLLPSAPPNIHYAPFVPALDVASRSHLIISHGAVGTTMLALFCGIPSIAIPTNSEREYYARRVAALNAGIHLPFEQVGPDTIGQTIDLLTNNHKYIYQTKLLSEKIRERGGPDAAADLTIRLAS